MRTAKEVARPIKRRIAAALGRDIICNPSIDRPLEWHGSSYGGRMILANSLHASSVVYSFGIGRDISFDESIIEKYGCDVHGFDPTPGAIDFVRQRDPPRFILHEFGLSDATGQATLYPPVDARHVTGSLVRASQLARTGFTVRVKNL